jgi:hypothetical protein
MDELHSLTLHDVIKFQIENLNMSQLSPIEGSINSLMTWCFHIHKLHHVAPRLRLD